jgi:hypothetical protein
MRLATIAELERFSSKVKREDDCWLWQKTIQWNGYGMMWFAGKTYAAHKFAYRQFIGEIGEGLVVDHLCRRRHCANPNHLEAVTPRENIMRGNGVAAMNAAKTHCTKGHPYSHINGQGRRVCRICINRTSNNYQKRRRLANV